jgi:hypothetical protein
MGPDTDADQRDAILGQVGVCCTFAVVDFVFNI